MEHPNTDSPERNVRVAPLSNIEPLLRSMGYDPEPIFRTVGLDPKYFLDNEHRIPYAKGACLLGRCANTTGYDHFGLLLGQFFLIAQMGIPGRLANTASNVKAALHDIVAHRNLHDQVGVAILHTSSRYTNFGYVISIPDIEVVDPVYDLCISIICGIMRSFCGQQWNPTRVELSRNLPADSQPYKDFFRAPVQFGTLRNSVVFPNRWLSHPLVTADADSHEHLAEDARILHQSMPDSVSMAVRIALHSTLTYATCTAATIAGRLGVHERTMHRRLQSEGTSFRELLDETRKIMSRNYLKGTSLSINSIAIALGYASTGAFDHAFHRWFGKSPKQLKDSEEYSPTTQDWSGHLDS